MAGTSVPKAAEVADQTDPERLLDLASGLEAFAAVRARTDALDRLAELIDAGALPAAPAGRDWQLELTAERANDAATAGRPEEALELAARVLATASEDSAIATARAILARGRALARLGGSENLDLADDVLADAGARFAALGRRDWAGFTLAWRGYAVSYESGRLSEAATLITEALEVLGHSSPRRATVLDFYADVLVDLGEWDRATEILDQGYALADLAGDAQARAYVTWTRALVAAGRGDSAAAERLFREVERDATDWWERYGDWFLCDAALALDTLGLTPQARGYLARAIAPTGADDSPAMLLLARALLEARSGDPVVALDQWAAISADGALEGRLIWRGTLLSAWATLRTGDRDRAGALAAVAFAQADANHSIRVAQAAEPDITAALAPLAAEAGSPHARALIGDGGRIAVRLFGEPSVSDAAGAAVQLPPGMPGAVVRMLALEPHGLPVEVVLEHFFPEADPTASRHRLRQVLSRLRSAAGDIVVRDGEILRLAPAWVDVQEFGLLVRRARAGRGTRSLILNQAALALAGRGPLLPGDPEAVWAEETRERVAADLERLGGA